jgi:hypothetical protein
MVAALCWTAATARQTAAATAAAPAPAWQAISAMAEEAEQSERYDPALAWLSARGPIRSAISSGDDVEALLSLTQAWAARGGQRLQGTDTQGGIDDLSAILQHGAAVERHAHTLQVRATGAQIQDLALQILEIAPLQALTTSARAELLMVLGEAAVIPSATDSASRQCQQDAAAIRSQAYPAALTPVQALLVEPEQTALLLLAGCAQEALPSSRIRNTEGARLAEGIAQARRAEHDALSAFLADNDARRKALREQLARR